MRYEDDRIPETMVQSLQLGAHLEPEAGVQIGEWLVEEQDIRPGRQHSGQRDPLLLPPAELRRVALFHAVDAQQHHHLVHAPLAFGPVHPLHLSPNATFWKTVMCGHSA